MENKVNVVVVGYGGMGKYHADKISEMEKFNLVGIYDIKDQLISLSAPITIPVKPNHHTLLKGKFLMQDSSNGVDIDPNWGGDHNIIL